MKIESAFNIRDRCWCTSGNGDIRPLTIGCIRTETIDSIGIEGSMFNNYKPKKSYNEQYMCVETGIGSGNLYTLGRNIFRTEKEAVEAVDRAEFERKAQERAKEQAKRQAEQDTQRKEREWIAAERM